MSRQLSFYLTPADMRTAVGRISECGEIVLLHSRSTQPRPLPAIDFAENGQPCPNLVVTRPSLLDAIVLREVELQGYWSVDILRSPAIELRVSSYDGQKIGEGRLYFETSYFSQYGKVNKPEAFLSWASCVLKAFKKTLKRNARMGAYVGLDALSQSLSGQGVLSPLTFRSADAVKTGSVAIHVPPE